MSLMPRFYAMKNKRSDPVILWDGAMRSKSSCYLFAKKRPIKCALSRLSRGDCLHTVFTAEFINPASSIQHLLFACIKRMTLWAHIDMQIIFMRRARLEWITATASNAYFLVCGVYFCFHKWLAISKLSIQCIATGARSLLKTATPSKWVPLKMHFSRNSMCHSLIIISR